MEHGAWILIASEDVAMAGGAETRRLDDLGWRTLWGLVQQRVRVLEES